MSRKLVIIIDVLLAILLVALLFCEWRWPGAGTKVIMNILG